MARLFCHLLYVGSDRNEHLRNVEGIVPEMALAK